MKQEEIHAWLEANVKGGLDPKIWEYLVNRRFVRSVERRRADLAWLAREYQVLKKLTGHPQPPSKEEEGTAEMGAPARAKPGREQGVSWTGNLDERQLALSILLVQKAARDSDVTAFRQEVLSSTPLPQGQKTLEAWIDRQAKRDGPPTIWLTDVPVPEGHEFRQLEPAGPAFTEPPLAVSREQPAHGFAGRWLTCAVGRHTNIEVPTAAGGVLERLRQLGERLADGYCWHPGQAANFVLTGAMPRVRLLRLGFPDPARSPGGITALSRIKLELDPAHTPKQVAAIYRNARKQMLLRRFRAMSTRHLQLAAFASEHLDGDDWAGLMQQWNNAYPDWEYKHPSDFKRDAEQAQRRLLYPNYQHPERGERRMDE